MDVQVSKTCKAAWFHLRNVSKIKSYLPEEQLKTVIHAFVISQLDFNNLLLAGSRDNSIAKLQRVQNAAARLVTGTDNFSHITPVLKHLHWLPVHHRITFKLLLTAFKAMQGIGPSYLLDLLAVYNPTPALRSASSPLLLTVPRTRLKTYGDKSFSVSVPVRWNQLPPHIRDCKSPSAFKSSLKTYLFRRHFTDNVL